MSPKTLGLLTAELHISAYALLYGQVALFRILFPLPQLTVRFDKASLFLYLNHPGGFQLYVLKNSSWNGIFFKENVLSHVMRSLQRRQVQNGLYYQLNNSSKSSFSAILNTTSFVLR